MKAVTCRRYGAPGVLRLENLPRPTPRKNEVLVRVSATTVTSGDVRMRSFRVPGVFWLPMRLMIGVFRPRNPVSGMEFAGRIEAVGRGVKDFRVGDQVFGMKLGGANAEFVTVPERGLIASKPSQLTDAEAAAMPFGALSALAVLKNAARISRGQKVLIYGASGAVGVFAVQIAKYFGCEVTGVCSAANLDLVGSLGADEVIDYAITDFTGGSKRYDVILDTVGVTSFDRCRRVLTPQGRHVYVAFQGRQILQMVWTFLWRGQRVICSISGESRNDFLFARALVTSGAVRPVVDRIYDLHEIVDAHRYVDTGRKIGAVVIRVGGPPADALFQARGVAAA